MHLCCKGTNKQQTNKKQTHTHRGKLAASACCIFNCVLHIWIVFIYLNSQLHFSHYFCYNTDAFNDSIAVCVRVCVPVCVHACVRSLFMHRWVAFPARLLCLLCAAFLCIFKAADRSPLLTSSSSPAQFLPLSRCLCLCVCVCIIIVCCMQQRVNISIYSACLQMLMLIYATYT